MRFLFPALLITNLLVAGLCSAQQQDAWVPQGIEALQRSASSRTGFSLNHSMLALAAKIDPDNEDLQRVIAGVSGVSMRNYRFQAAAYNPDSLKSVNEEYRAAGSGDQGCVGADGEQSRRERCSDGSAADGGHVRVSGRVNQSGGLGQTGRAFRHSKDRWGSGSAEHSWALAIESSNHEGNHEYLQIRVGMGQEHPSRGRVRFSPQCAGYHRRRDDSRRFRNRQSLAASPDGTVGFLDLANRLRASLSGPKRGRVEAGTIGTS